MIDRKHIGAATEEVSIDVERSQLRLFCQAIGETNPVFFDEAAARAAGHERIPTPPTYPQTLLNLSPFRRTWCWTSSRPTWRACCMASRCSSTIIRSGSATPSACARPVADIYDKKGGALEFIVLETLARNQDDIVCATLKSVAVIRN
jgi:hypothetical protein